jgi:probable phosphoglycerate mutase
VSEPRVFLLRHGETEWSRSGKHTGRTDIPLTDRGRLLAKATGDVGRYLLRDDPAVVWCSPRMRARDTAALAGLTVDHVDERLVEWDYGDYEGMTSKQIREISPNWTIFRGEVPGGETAAQVQERADRVLDQARAALPGGPVLLFGHGHINRVLAARWIEEPVMSGEHLALGTAAPCLLGMQHFQPVIVRWNLPNPAAR